MKTIITLSLIGISLMACKEKTGRVEAEPVYNIPPVYAIDLSKPAGSLRVIIKPLCYDDINGAFMRSKTGC